MKIYTRRGDAGGEAMMAGCVFFGSAIPVLILALVGLALARSRWSQLSDSIRLLLWVNAAAVVPVFVITSLAWELLSPY